MRYFWVALLWILAAPALLAHNFWIETSTFTPAPGQRLSVRLRVGQELQGDPVPRDPALIKRFVAVGPAGGETPVPGVPNTEPAGFEVFPAPGLYTLVRSRVYRGEVHSGAHRNTDAHPPIVDELTWQLAQRPNTIPRSNELAFSSRSSLKCLRILTDERGAQCEIG